MWYSRVDTNQPKGASSLMDSITQDMKYRYSLMKYAEKYGVSRASRKYDKSRSYIYFWRKRFDGTIESLACRSRRPHSHPKQHTPEKMKLIQKMRRRNPKLGIVELWARLKSRRYSRCVESLQHVLRWKAPSQNTAQTLRADAVSPTACPDQRESRFPLANVSLTRNGSYFSIRHRRIFTPSGFGRLSRAKHLSSGVLITENSKYYHSFGF